MKTKHLVSVIIPVFNVEDYLKECLNPILAQTYKHIEVILVDDGSTDESGTICDEYSKRYDFISVIHKQNEGVNFARRDGLLKSKGQFIAFVDADDIVANDYIEKHLELLNSTSSDISVGKTHNFYGITLSQAEIDQCNVKSDSIDFTVWTDKKSILSAFITSLPPYSNMALMCIWSKLYRRGVLENIDWNIANYIHGEDYFINAQAYNNAKSVCYINEYCYYYRRTRAEKLTLNAKENISPTGEKISNLAYVKALAEMYKNLSNKNGIDLSKEIVITQCRLYTYWLEKLINNGTLTSETWDKYIIKELLPLVTEFESDEFANYMRNNLVYGERLHKELTQKLDIINKNKSIEEFLLYKISVLKEQTTKPQIFTDYSDAWVIMDRPDSATDNGYHFYKWIKKNHPTINAFFVINSDSKDIPKLKEDGFNLVFTNTDQHLELLNNCSVEIYAYYTFNMCTQRTNFNSIKVYLSHGVKLNNSLNPGLSKSDYFVTTFKREFDFFKLNHNDFITIQTGLPRYESLSKNSSEEKTHIVIAPQWRRWLNKKASKEDNYFVQWSNFIQSEELRKLSSQYKVAFMIHPELESKSDFMEIPNYIEKLKYNDLGAVKIQELMKQTKLLVTDFSSVAVDYAIAGSDIVYFQFDRDEYYNNHTAKKGWFDYDLDGFGPVFFDLNDLKGHINQVRSALEIDTDKYKRRLQNLIGNDSKNLEHPSENIYKIITDTLNNRENNF